jgi:hypothetical protein
VLQLPAGANAATAEGTVVEPQLRESSLSIWSRGRFALIAAAIRRATGTAGGLQIGFGYFYPSGRVLDSFSHFPHINTR